jgi:hypothetical protein
MKTIEFQSKQFKVREIELPQIGNVLISTESLNQLLLNDIGGYVSDEAMYVDEKIYYYIDELEFGLNNEDLIALLNFEVL